MDGNAGDKGNGTCLHYKCNKKSVSGLLGLCVPVKNVHNKVRGQSVGKHSTGGRLQPVLM